MTAVAEALAAKHRPAEAVLEHVGEGADVVVGVANGEPRTVLDALEAAAGDLRGVRAHQMLPLRTRPSMTAGGPGLRHVSWFLGPADREAFHAGTCDLVPNNFSDVPRLLRATTTDPLVVVSVAPPDRHGYFSLGTNAEYPAALIGEARFFVEVNRRMPRTFGENQLHVSQLLGWCEADYPLVEMPAPPATEADRRIAALVAERVPHEATLQAGIGSVPNAVLELLRDHHHLGVHTELLSDGFVDLVECGALTGTRKSTHRNAILTTTAGGTQRLYDFVDENPGIEFWPVEYTNDPRNIGRQHRMTAINATMEVDFLGQCASESLGSRYWSSSGGQADFVRGAMFADGGQAFIVLHATPSDGSCSRIVPQLRAGAAVTTFKNVVDKVVTEHGVAELRGSSIAERTRRLIAIAAPEFRDELTHAARRMGYLR